MEGNLMKIVINIMFKRKILKKKFKFVNIVEMRYYCLNFENKMMYINVRL